MEYQLTAEVNPPSDAPDLDALQRHGVAALLDEHLELLAEIEGPDGVEIEPLDHRIMVHPGGASISWLLDAPALSFAEEAARTVLTELLERTELLAEWHVGRCEVIASAEDLAAALGEPDAEPATLGEPDEIELAELESITGMGGLTEADRAARRDQLLAAGRLLRAFGPEAFGHDDETDEGPPVSAEAAGLVAGALMLGLDVLIEELFADVQSLDEAGTPAAEHEVLWVLHDLPPRFADHYTALFAKKFLLTAAVLGYRLAGPDWSGPLNTAEALALHLVKVSAEGQLELAELTDELPLERIFESFDEWAFGEVDVAALYDADAAEESEEADDDAEATVLAWFESEPEYDEDDADADAATDDATSLA